MGQYTNSTLAKREAKMAGYDEAVLMDVNGYVSEGSGENLFIVKRGKLITPPLSASILEGVTRDTVLTLAREDAIPVSEEMITRDQLYLADRSVPHGNRGLEVTPIHEVDNRKVGDGLVGPITKRMQQRYFDVVKGADARFGVANSGIAVVRKPPTPTCAPPNAPSPPTPSPVGRGGR